MVTIEEGHSPAPNKRAAARRKALRDAFMWHGMRAVKLETNYKGEGLTWQDCERYRDRELAAAGFPNLFAEFT